MNKSPKEKAKELFNQYHNLIQDIGGDLGHEILVSILAKNCALIAVDEILQTFNNEWTKLDFWTEEINGTINFWQEVEQEINNL
jgi:hypothetical protein